MNCFPGELTRNFLYGEQKHGHVRQCPGNLSSRLKTIAVRHCQIENNDVRVQFSGFADGFVAVAGIRADMPFRMRFQQAAEEPSDRDIVISNQNAYSHNRGGLSPRPLLTSMQRVHRPKQNPLCWSCTS